MDATGSEAVRLVVWDLDETFWHGTVSEGGHRYRPEMHDMVVSLAQRGIVSSICSKNDKATVRTLLEREGIWDYFVFPSISWEPKGPRLKQLVEQVQLRPSTILFIDDNPMNLAEARHYVPGIQVADEHFIEQMLENPLLRGKPDPDLSRLRQYQVLQTRKADQAEATARTGGDHSAFLRESGIVVTIDHDVGRHLDRAIELINRTNQLNFTKRRLSEDTETARAELRDLLAHHATQAGILHMKDRFGDYGYCGLYVVTSGTFGQMKHFCFSCRILDTGVETWLYNRLGRPKLRIVGEVLADVLGDMRDIDWITLRLPGVDTAPIAAPRTFDYVFARGGCDLNAVAHYFSVTTGAIHGEYNAVENGVMLPLHHSAFARHAITGLPDTAENAFRKLGYRASHFRSLLSDIPKTGSALWLLSFWAEDGYALYEHTPTGRQIPIAARCFKHTLQDITKVTPEEFPPDAELIAYVKKHFAFKGMIGEAAFKETLRMIFGAKTPGTRVFVLLAADKHLNKDNMVVINRRKHTFNQWTVAVAKEFDNIETLSMTDYADTEDYTRNPNHFDRMAYFRVFQDVMRRVGDGAVRSAAE